MPTNIAWTDETWNPVHGCSKVSAGCDNCYAERISFHQYGHTDEPWTPEIADELGCSQATVWNWLDRHGIETRDPSPVADERLTDPDWLFEQYHGAGLSTTEIADELGCSDATVLKWLDRHGIETRPPGRRSTGDKS